MKAKNFHPGDSLKTIEDAIMQAKTERTGARFYYILWGLLMLLHYTLLYVTARYPALNGGLADTLIYIVFPVGGLLSYFRSRKDAKKETVIPHFEKVYLYGFSGFALSYGIIFIASVYSIPELPVSLFPLLLGLAVFVTGGITKFMPSVICGIAGIICTGISLNTELETRYALAALSSFIVCVIPGYLMKNKHV